MKFNSRLVNAPLLLAFSKENQNRDAFRFEYEKLSQMDDDPISQWVRVAKARGETKDTDPILLNLIMELHRKIDMLEKLIKNEEPKYLELEKSVLIDKIGHGVLTILEPIFEKEETYYGRIDLPTFPKRVVPLYFVALDNKSAEIKIMHERDIRDWDAYIAARERALIREKKGLDG